MPVVITISGAPGSGAWELGHLVAQRLGVELVDRELLADAARRLGVAVEQLARRDERCLSLREKVALFLRQFLERSALLGADPLSGGLGLELILAGTYADMATRVEEGEGLPEEAYIQVLTTLMRELAARGDVVILGRGSHMVLQGHPHALHVLAIAPKEERLRRFAQREGLGLEEAARRLHQTEKGRQLFYRRYWKVDPDDPSYYHLTVETSRLPLEVAVEVVAVAAGALRG
ncbi:MAG: cytidylate kinase-like family protein [Dehalococcoidia bacterium]|nr:cytidylate kinase-like family protein [Dehalococcoidia bacterium]